MADIVINTKLKLDAGEALIAVRKIGNELDAIFAKKLKISVNTADAKKDIAELGSIASDTFQKASAEATKEVGGGSTKVGGLFSGLKKSFMEGKEAGKEATGVLGDWAKKAGSLASPAGLASAGLEKLVDGLKNAFEVGQKFQTGLAAISSKTGIRGSALIQIGDQAQTMAAKFGGSATDQLTNFQGIISKFGNDIAKTPEDLTKVSDSVNTFAKATGTEASKALDTLSSSMESFGVDTHNSGKLASESARFINVMTSAARLGGADVTQIGESVKIAGSEMKKAGVSFEEGNAAIQVFATQGKTGADAGNALKNVLGTMSNLDVIPAEGLDRLKSLGVDIAKVTDTSLPLSARLTELGKASGDATAFAKVFGDTNAEAAIQLVDGAAKIGTWTQEITGTTAATDQAATNMDTLAERISRGKTTFENFGIDVFESIAPIASKVMDVVSDAFSRMGDALGPALVSVGAALAPIGIVIGTVFGGAAYLALQGLTGIVVGLGSALNFIAPALGVLTVGMGLFLAITNATAIKTAIVTGLEAARITLMGVWEAIVITATLAQIAWNAAMSANPIGAVVLALTLLVAGVVALTAALTENSQEQLENAENQKKSIDVQVKDNEEKKKAVTHTQSLVTEYQNLAKKTNLSATEQKRLQEIQGKLDEQYPDLIDQTKSFSENLSGVGEIGKRTTDTMEGLTKQGDALQKQLSESVKVIASAKRNVAVDELRDVLGSFHLGDFFFKGSANEFRKEFGKMRDEFEKNIFTAKTSVEVDEATSKILKFVNENSGKLGDDSNKIASDLILAIQKVAAAQKAAQEAYLNKKEEIAKNDIKSATEEEKNTKALGNINTKNNDKKLANAKEIINIDKEIKDLKLATQYLEAEESAKIDDDKLSRAQSAQKKSLDNLQKQFDAEEEKRFEAYLKIIDNDKISAEQRKEFEDKTSKFFLAHQEKFRIQEAEIKTKYADEQLKEEQKNLDETFKIQLDENKKQIDTLNAQKTKSSEDEQKRLKAINDTEIARIIIQANQKGEISSRLNADIIAAEEVLRQALMGSSEQAVTDARTNLTNKKLDYLKNNGEIIAQNSETNQKIAEQNAKYALQLREQNLNQIASRSEREKEARLIEVEKTLVKELEAAQGNERLKIEATRKAARERSEIEKEAAREQSGLLAQTFGVFSDAIESASSSLIRSIGSAVEKTNELNKEARKNAKAELEKETNDAFQASKGRVITYEQYIDKINEINAKYGNESSTLWSNIGKSIQDTFKTSFQDISDKSKATFAKLSERLNKNGENIKQIDEEVAQNKEKLGKGTLDEDKKITEQNDQLLKLRQANIDDDARVTKGIYASVAMSAAAAFGASLAAGEASLGGFLIMALDALQALVPIFAAQIYGAMVSSPNPINIASLGTAGLLAATGITVGLTALVQIAKAAISGFKTGGYTGDGGRDEAAGVVHKGEGVLEQPIIRGQVSEFLELRSLLQNGVSIREVLGTYKESRNTLNGLTLKEVLMSNNLSVAPDGALVTMPQTMSLSQSMTSEGAYIRALERQTAELRSDNEAIKAELVKSRTTLRQIESTVNIAPVTLKASGDDLQAVMQKKMKYRMNYGG